MIRILIAEDQGMLLGAMAALLDLEDDMEVVFKAKDGQDALDYLTGEDSPLDIVITDIEMPRMTGIELCEQIRERGLNPKTIILTTFSRSGYLRRAMDAGVRGYLLKDAPSDDLIGAIRKIHAGGRSVAAELVGDAWMELDPLTDKERKALRLAKDGLTTEQISEKLHLSCGTIRNYLSSAANKLDAKNRVEAARIAHQKGWL